MGINSIVFISDTHEQEHLLKPLPEADLLAHCGDITWDGSLAALSRFNVWLGRQPHRHKVIIAGNHDGTFERSRMLAESIVTNAIYLQDSGIELEGLRIWGSPWTPRFNNWYFNADAEIVRYWDLIPLDTELLITHGPPQGILDLIPGEGHLGCPRLMAKVLQIKPRIHAFGHVHEAYGKAFFNGTEFVNAAVLGHPMKPPMLIEGLNGDIEASGRSSHGEEKLPGV